MYALELRNCFVGNETYNGRLRTTYQTPAAANKTSAITMIGTKTAANVPLPGLNDPPNDRSQLPPTNSGRQSHTKSPESSSRHNPPFWQGQIRGDGRGRSAAASQITSTVLRCEVSGAVLSGQAHRRPPGTKRHKCEQPLLKHGFFSVVL